MMQRILIANRGEIAVRVARTVRALGMTAIGVYSDADAAAPHVEACDLAVRIGPAAAIDSYLKVDAILVAAARSGADAVHPGYGFLSENAAFARAVTDAGLIWIGPPVAAIELMGDKGAAKQAAAAAGVPVIPDGAGGGFPVIVKAVAGGGGKGMRVVRSAGELEAATAAARREAHAAFGDDRVIVERYLERPRHIEIQVLADAHGTVIHLGERECSLQRRHQKVVEEAPSSAVDAALRERMGAAAVALARACEYRGAGTVEFIVDERGEFFFLEMNTRLQVEHPVTELVHDVDLVEQQLRAAAGEPLTVAPGEPAGWAIEARLYAEDPAAGFLPATGALRRYREPPGVRIDSGVREGHEIGTDYDPLLAKVIAHGPDRATAIARLHRALGDLELLGVATNAAFTRALLERDDVRAGAIDTGLLERVLSELDPAPPDDLLPAAALAAAGTAHPAGPWRRAFELGEIRIADGRITLDPHSASKSKGTVPLMRKAEWSAAVRGLGDGAWQVTLDGVTRRYVAHVTDDAVWIARDGHQLEARTVRPARDGAGAVAGSLEAPMPGTVLIVNVANGDTVKEGDVLLVLESMKMELTITAPHAGVVEGLELAAGDRVAVHQPLVAIAATEDAS